jgi:hypothetical protein
VLEAATEGTLPADDMAELIRMILDGYPPDEARAIFERILRTSSALPRGRRGQADEPFEVSDTIRSFVISNLLDVFGHGALMSFDEASRRLSRQQEAVAAESILDAHRRNSEVLALFIDGEFAIPVFQFAPARGSLRPTVARVNRALGAYDDPWGVTAWWIQPDARLQTSPARLLNRRDTRELVIALAESSLEPVG